MNGIKILGLVQLHSALGKTADDAVDHPDMMRAAIGIAGRIETATAVTTWIGAGGNADREIAATAAGAYGAATRQRKAIDHDVAGRNAEARVEGLGHVAVDGAAVHGVATIDDITIGSSVVAAMGDAGALGVGSG